MSDNIKIMEKKNEIWLIGAGGMAQDYAKVLKDLGVSFKVIGRGKEKAKQFKEQTGIDVIEGGVERYIKSTNTICTHSIVAVGVESLYSVTKQLLSYGIKNILVEKPAGISKQNLLDLKEESKIRSSNVLIGYNRRFYKATQKAKEIIAEDGGVKSFNFEFTEWSHVIANLDKPKNVFETWFLGNSTHVVDLAFYLGGKPKEINTFTRKGNLEWHPSASVFVGAGCSDSEALFCYQANWEAPGRWSVEVLTNKHRLIFRPMEKLQIQNIGSVAVDYVDIDYKIDEDYKAGLFEQVRCFWEGEWEQFCTLDWQIEMFGIYLRMANYNKL